jgi:LAGLIDADG DNA endonuclease family protein
MSNITCLRCNKYFPKIGSCRNYCHNCYSYLICNKLIPRTTEVSDPFDLPQSFSNEQKQVLNGLMLGDGSLDHRPHRNSRLIIIRSGKDIKYLEWNHQIFENFCKILPIRQKTFLLSTNNKYYTQCLFRTRGCPLFNDIRNTWYPNGIKLIPKSLVLTPLTLAVWIADDGWIGGYTKYNRVRTSIATNCFTEDDVRWLCERLTNMVGGNFHHNIAKSKNGKIQFVINAANIATKKLVAIIKPYLYEMHMERKINKIEYLL